MNDGRRRTMFLTFLSLLLLSQAQAHAATVLGSFSTSNTNYANVTDPDTRTFTIADIVPGTTVRVGTCGFTGATNTGPVIIRILNAAGVTIASADWGCGTTASALTAIVVPRVSTSAHLRLLPSRPAVAARLRDGGSPIHLGQDRQDLLVAELPSLHRTSVGGSLPAGSEKGDHVHTAPRRRSRESKT